MDLDERWPHDLPEVSGHEPLRRVCVSYLLRDRAGVTQVLLGREEESGVVVDEAGLDRRGDLCYLFPDRPSWSQRSTVFVVTEWRGEPAPSDELDPVWFDLDQVPYDEMWDDAKKWLPGVLIGGHVSREFTFAADLSTVAEERAV